VVSAKAHNANASAADGPTKKAQSAAITEVQPMLQRNALIGAALEATTRETTLSLMTNQEIRELVSLAKKTLQSICKDDTAGASSRAAAARTLLELAGALKNPQRNQAVTPVAEATSAEIDERLAALAGADSKVID
jgi:hypothetical protein